MDRKQEKQKGFTLLVSIIVTSILLLISFVVANVALKQLVLAYTGQESQYSFYNADSGVECAMYWDLKNGGGSAFATSSTGAISCNNVNITTNSQVVHTIPNQYSRIGGPGPDAVSIFEIQYIRGCAIVQVTKQSNNQTLIESRGYNTSCGDTTSDRKFERGIKILY
jgi:Tfp pilus assembly protein PilX